MIKLYKKLSDKNKTVVKVTAVHFIFIFALLFQGINFSKPKKNNISVRTISINEPLKLVIKKTIEKPKNKVVTNNKPASKKVIKKTINKYTVCFLSHVTLSRKVCNANPISPRRPTIGK